MTDECFLRALADDPNDDVTRLVYADWLEERGDGRAEFVRAEVALTNASAGQGQAEGEMLQRAGEAAGGRYAESLVSVSRAAIARGFGLAGSWRMEGISTLIGRPSPDEADDVWRANRAGPRARRGMRNVGFTFRADGSGSYDLLNLPRSRPPEPFSWRVETEEAAMYLALNFRRPEAVVGRMRFWARLDGRMLLSTLPDYVRPETASFLLRYDPPPTFKTRRRRG